ncbi:hypothetical protein ACHQM5_007678 [Ranunculus cassubicifolius]
MGLGKMKGKSGFIHKTWERCRSFGNKKFEPNAWVDSPEEDRHSSRRKSQVVPEGCFSVYVGPEKQRFVIKTSCINHPLFKMLLEEAEVEYGYNSGGPLVLPCGVDVFYKVLSEMEGDEIGRHHGCSFVKGYGSYHLVSPSRVLAV